MNIRNKLTAITLCLLIAGCAATTHESEQTDAMLPVVTAIQNHAKSSKSPSNQEDRGRIVEEVLEQVVTLKAVSSSGDVISQGSGFFIEGNRVVTNAHVTAGAAWIEIFDISGSLLGTAPYALALNIDIDLAILPAPGVRRSGLRVSTATVKAGDPIWAFGAPLGLDGTVSTGIISARRTDEDREYLQITAPISQGSSGGPIVNANGEVLGAVVSMVTGAQNINFAIPSSYILALDTPAAARLPFPDEDAMTETEIDLALNYLSLILALALAEDIEIGNTIRGDLDEDSLIFDTPIEVYRFFGWKDREIRIDAISPSIDTVALLIHADSMFEENEWSVADDDSGHGTNARIVAQLPFTGEYYIIITSYDGSYGRFFLSVDDRSVASDPPAVVSGVDRWIAVSETATAVVYIDSETIIRSGNNVTFWVRGVYFSPTRDVSGKLYDTTFYLHEISCNRRKLSIKSYTNRSRGEVVTSLDIPSLEQTWQSIVPGSVGESYYRYVCP